MSIVKQTVRIATGIAVTALIAFGCSWGYPIWQKNPKSDVPLFRFQIKEKDGTGYIDRTGKVVIPPTLSPLDNSNYDDFFDGLASVRMNGESWFIDRNGMPVFKDHGYLLGHFSEGLASTLKNGKAGFIDRTGKIVIPESFDIAGDFAEGVAVVEVHKRYGYINKNGSFAIQPKYTRAESFSEGIARVIEEGPCLYIPYDPCGAFEMEVLPYDPNAKRSADPPRCRYSFIDKQGKRLFENKYPDAKDFAEGLAPVGDGAHWGYVDKKGAIVIPMKYDNAEPFAEGLARVRLNSKWGYIDQTGKMVLPAIYQTTLDFSEGLAVVSVGDFNYWFIDKSGHRALPQTYTAASNFVMGLAHVRTGVDYYSAKWSYIDHSGHAVFAYSDESRGGRNAP